VSKKKPPARGSAFEEAVEKILAVPVPSRKMKKRKKKKDKS
jgi:hypothetical protein